MKIIDKQSGRVFNSNYSTRSQTIYGGTEEMFKFQKERSDFEKKAKDAVKSWTEKFNKFGLSKVLDYKSKNATGSLQIQGFLMHLFLDGIFGSVVVNLGNKLAGDKYAASDVIVTPVSNGVINCNLKVYSSAQGGYVYFDLGNLEYKSQDQFEKDLLSALSNLLNSGLKLTDGKLNPTTK